MPIVVPFYKANGLGMKDVMLLQGVYSITIVILEIPSGYFADVIGRKKTIVIGAFMGFLGFLTYSLSFGFWGFLLAETILGIGQSFISGSDSALLYDTLLDLKREGEYIKFEGRLTSFGNIAEAVAGTLGGLLAAASVRYPYIAQTFVAFLAVPSSLLLIEPSRHKRLLKMRFKDILATVRYALIEDKPLKRNILFSSITGTATLTMAWFVQPFFEHVHLSLQLYGILWTALNLTVGLVALAAYKIEARLGPVHSVLIIATLVPAGYICLYFFHSIYAISILFLFYVVRGFATPVLKDYINRMTVSETRATVLSVRNFHHPFEFRDHRSLPGMVHGRLYLSAGHAAGRDHLSRAQRVLRLSFCKIPSGKVVMNQISIVSPSKAGKMAGGSSSAISLWRPIW